MIRQYYSPFPFFPIVSPYASFSYYYPYVYSPFYPYGVYQQPPGTTIVSGGSDSYQHLFHVPLHGH